MSDTGNGKAEAMQPSLRLVSDRFQQVGERATRLFGRDIDFRDLCDEYEACVETVARLQSGGAPSEDMRKEYAALLLRIERELLRYMEEHPDREKS